MKIRERRFSENPRLMVIPMIDIIFFLLVFFMMSTMFMIEQKVLPVVLPSASATQAETGQTLPVTVLGDGTIRVGEKAVTPSLLMTDVQSILRQDKEARFVLHADRSVEYGRVVQVLDMLKKAGVQRLSIAVEQLP